jgi:hypothetical protein
MLVVLFQTKVTKTSIMDQQCVWAGYGISYVRGFSTESNPERGDPAGTDITHRVNTLKWQ